MHSIHAGVLALLVPMVGLAQAVPPSAGKTVVVAPAYRGFTPGGPYRAFAERARTLAPRDTLRCNTSRNTAQLMECGVVIRDPTDGANFYLSAYVLEGKVAMVRFYDSAGFGDTARSRGAGGAGAALVDRSKRELTKLFGRPRPVRKTGWEWPYGHQVVRFSWRGRGPARWVSITLTDNDVMDRISRYVRRPAPARKS